MNVLKDGFNVRKIAKTDLEGAVAPIYLLGLPGDLDGLEAKIRDL